ncbi:40S ribosomal protein S11-B, partial [Coemansia sp. RSA 455]
LISTIAESSGGCYRRVKNNMGELLDMIGFLCPAQSLVSKLADSEHTTDCDLDFESVSHLDISILEWPCADSPMASRNRATERSFQKQDAVFLNAKSVSKKNARWHKDIGLGFKTPAEAISGTYIDKKCPFTGNVSIRGRILSGVVKSTKMKRTIIVRREYLHYITKYQRYEKRHKNIAAHLSPAFIGVEVGDIVTVGQCRPLSKTIRFNVIKHQKKQVKGSKRFQKF